MKSSQLMHFNEETRRNKKLTKFISVTSSVIFLFLGLLYLEENLEENLTLSFNLFLSSLIFIAPYLLVKRGYPNAGRLLLCILLPIAIMAMSIMSKIEIINHNLASPADYFDVRYALINTVIIPIVIYSKKEYKWLIVSSIPAVVSLILFDPIHEFFKTGYYDASLTGKEYYFSANLFPIVTVFLLSGMIFYLKYQIFKGDSNQYSENAKIKLYLSQMVALSCSPNINNGKLDEAKKEILKVASVCLKVTRVSVWGYNKNSNTIKCEYLLEKGKISEPSTILSGADYPKYFRALKNQELIIATDAISNPNTSEFGDTYLKPLSICSMMDAHYSVRGEFGGVICCEHQHEIKQWDALESLFLKGLGDYLSYTTMVRERIMQNQLLTEKNLEISSINENLELMVKERTRELEQKNKQLTEYAYINSHVLRAPVARISGLYNLFRMEATDILEDSAIVEHMEKSIQDLEDITFQINRAIEESGSFDRKNIARNS